MTRSRVSGIFDESKSEKKKITWMLDKPGHRWFKEIGTFDGNPQEPLTMILQLWRKNFPRLSLSLMLRSDKLKLNSNLPWLGGFWRGVSKWNLFKRSLSSDGI